MRATDFLNQLTQELRPLITAVNKAYWDLNTNYSPMAETNYLVLKKKLAAVYADPNIFRTLKEFRDTQSNLYESRQIELLYRSFLPYQIPGAILDEIIELEKELESDFINFRANLDGKTVSDNDISSILAESDDTVLVREAWEASKQIGEVTAPKILKLVELRNHAARALGFPDFWEMALFTNELEPQRLLDLLRVLEKSSSFPFQQMKDQLDQNLAFKFGIKPADLRPWHYGDPFFQEVPNFTDLKLDPLLPRDLLPTAKIYYGEIGLDPSPILERSDLYERPGKSQHAFCTDLDSQGDVRILCNLRPTKYWLNTLLHELGHGLYDINRDPELPYFLQAPAHILVTEAIAMLFGRLVNDPVWIKTYLNIPPDNLENICLQVEREMLIGQLIFIRWGLVMVNFERELYQNPNCNLNSLWWSLVSKHQRLTPPERANRPDWAAKIHLGTAPVYYQNYILGELAASQLASYIRTRITPGESMVRDERIGSFLKEAVFKPGALRPWDELIKNATGSYLKPDAWEAELSLVDFGV